MNIRNLILFISLVLIPPKLFANVEKNPLIAQPILFYNYFSIKEQLLEYNDLQERIKELPAGDTTITIWYKQIYDKISTAVFSIKKDLGAYAILVNDAQDCFDPSCDVTQKIIDKLNIEYLESLPKNKILKYYETIQQKRRVN